MNRGLRITVAELSFQNTAGVSVTKVSESVLSWGDTACLYLWRVFYFEKCRRIKFRSARI